VLTSTDLVSWQELGGAMPPLDEEFAEYWAPEVSYWNGRFYLYYSVGDGTLMHIRVALADQPAGPFHDSGVRLTTEDFAIDPHVFVDNDTRWLFYATDFLTHSHVGTGTVRDRLLDPFTLDGEPAPVVRARHDWHLFDPQRAEKGGARWHTVEGPTVLRHKGVLYEMFSGGNWKTDSYGVGYAVAGDMETYAEWNQACDGVAVLPILRTTADVTGPGHNSVVRGPDNRGLYCVYHRWNHDLGRRQLAIDPLEWIGDELTVFGPTHTPQPAPNLPAIRWPAGTSEVADSVQTGWTTNSGSWHFGANGARQTNAEGLCEAWRSGGLDGGFVVECDVQASHWTDNAGTIGLYVSDATGRRVRFCLTRDGTWRVVAGNHVNPDPTTQSNTTTAFTGTRLIRVTASGHALDYYTDDSNTPHRVFLNGPPHSLGLFTDRISGQFRSFALTRGWHDSFEHPLDNLVDLGFETRDSGWTIASMELRHETIAPAGTIVKAAPRGAYEFVVNARLEDIREGPYGFFPAAAGIEEPGPLVALLFRPDGYALCVDHAGGTRLGDAPTLATLPSTFDPTRYEQFSFTIDGAHMLVRWRGTRVSKTPLERAGSHVGLYAHGRASFDMVRVTELTDGERWLHHSR
jgi:GH43 family beta-xylosidase